MSARTVTNGRPFRNLGALVVAGITAAFTVVIAPAFTAPASADTVPASVSPVIPRPASNVTADALPTVQIDGVVWSQAVVGNTVYAGGNFANARPAGAAPGTNLTPRSDLLSYDITTGNLNTSFAPSLNGQVKVVAASPDNSRVYIGGAFTTADGATRNRIAGYDTTTGKLITSFAPGTNATVNAIAATNTTVYAAGNFGTANGATRTYLAAFSASTGALLNWAPVTDQPVQAMVLSPDGSRLIIGGSFTTINSSPAYGLGAVDANTGASLPYAANQTVRDAGANAAILSLSTDGKAIYSAGYTYGNSGNFEGIMSSDPNTGNINWLADCHGDSYGASGSGNGIVYTVSHFHDCANIGGFPDTNPRSVWHRSTAFTTNPTGTVLQNTQGGSGYGNFGGEPSPSLIDWIPDLAVGTFTGQSQAAWTVTATNKYVVEGGEFPSVNNVAQQGLVRFAIPSLATNKQGPIVYSPNYAATAVARSATSVRLTWPSNWDRDDQTLTYSIYRMDKSSSTPIKTLTGDSQSWNLPALGYIDTGLLPGTTYQYKVKASDPSGNAQGTAWTSVTTPSSSTTDSAYVKDVLGAGASNYWRLDQAAGATRNLDYSGFNDLTLGTGVAGGPTGAIGGDADSASSFDGSATGFAASSTAVPGPNTFTESAWFSSTSTSGGKIVGFGDKNSGNSSNYDRHVYMDASGHINFGVYNNGGYVITSPNAYNDGTYHQVVASLSSAGMELYIDGRLTGTNAGTTIGQPYSGYWRVGGDSTWSGNADFAGTIDEVAIYPTVLSPTQVRQQYIDAGHTIPGATAPGDTYGKTVYSDSPSVYYRLDETGGTTATDLSGNGNNGTYYGGVTQGVSSPVSGASGTAATFNGVDGTVSTNNAVVNPTTYSEEAWFNTTSNAGGKIIGFGSSQSGLSGSYDRHVYMLADGQLVFGTYTGALNLATSPGSYNDGKWHQLVATQGPDGMTLFVDGQPVATNPQTSAQSYTGYWRIGGDNLNGWGADGTFFGGTIDEAAVFNGELTSAQVLSHYRASGAAVNLPPKASFSNSVSGSTLNVDGSASSDADGSVASYAWDFGDGGTATTAKAAHTYSASGTYSVSLTVTDDKGATNTQTQSVSVTVPVNHPPSASFTSSTRGLSASFDASGSTDPDGDSLTFAWDFGDGSPGTGVSPTHVYANGGVYTVRLTVTDLGGLTSSSTAQVSINKPPTALFTSNSTDLSVNFDGTASTDSDGSIASYAWDFGDQSSGSGATTSHSYSAAGTYSVVLTVTDNQGAIGKVSKTVTVKAANIAPTASFTATPTNLSVALDASASVDPDGSIGSYAWDFGDSATGTGKTTTHAYSATGTYPVKLTVTDDQGATTSKTINVSVSAPTAVAADSYGRTVANGWGAADSGGGWTVGSPASQYSVGSGTAKMTLPKAGTADTASMTGLSQLDFNSVIDSSINQAATGNGISLSMIGRQVGKNNYQAKVRYLPNGGVHVVLSKVVNGTETIFKEVNVSGLTYNVGDTLRMRFTLVTTNSSTTLATKVWKVGTTEPTTAQAIQVDSDSSLQKAGNFGLQVYLSGSATNTGLVTTFDNLLVTAN